MHIFNERISSKQKEKISKFATAAVAILLTFVLCVQPLGYSAYAVELEEDDGTTEQTDPEYNDADVDALDSSSVEAEASANDDAAATVTESAATVGLELAEQATLTYNDIVFANTDESFEVPVNQELDFTVAANDGYQVSAVKTVAGDVEADLAADENGVYKVDADQVTNNLTIKVEVTAIADNDVAGIATMSADGEIATLADIEDSDDIDGGNGTQNNPYKITVGGSAQLSETPSFYGPSWSISKGNEYCELEDVNNGIYPFWNATATLKISEEAPVGETIIVKYGNSLTYFEVVSNNRQYTVSFNPNGGRGTTPDSVTNVSGFTFEAPDANLSRYGYTFVGWSTVSNYTETGDNKNYTNAFYRVGDEIRIGNQNIILYAVWAQADVNAEFYIRLDGKIPTEPQGHDVSEYSNAITIRGAIKNAVFYFNSSVGVDDQLNQVPTDQQIKQVYPSYDSNTQYVLWYVIKNEQTWHVDGVLLSKEKINLTYDANAPDGTWSNMPDGTQYNSGETVTAGKHTDGNLRVPEREGYSFVGWNTKSDGTGTKYTSGQQFVINENTTLYAQWVKDGDQQKEVTYAVEYYKDGQKVDSDSYTVSDSVWVNDPDEITIKDAIDVSDDKYIGYKFDHSEPGTVPKVGEAISSGTTIKVYYVKDDSQTQPTNYTVKYTIEDVEQPNDAITVSGTAWINDDPAMITIAEGGIPAPADKYTGYKLDENNPTYPEAGTQVESGTTYTVNYVADFTEFSVAGDEWTYDGSSRYVQVDGIYPGDTLTYQYGDNTVTATVNENSEIEGAPAFTNVSDTNEVTVTLTRGQSSTSLTTTMIISPAPLTVTTPSASKTYDGTPLTAEGTIEGLVNNETVGFTTTGSQTEVGSSTNTYTIVWAADDNEFTAQESNYTINENLGTLKVTEAPSQDISEGTTGNTDNNGTDQDSSSSLVKTSDMVMPGVVIGIVLIAAACVAFATYKSRRPRGRHTK